MSWYFGFVCPHCGCGERNSSATEPRPVEEPAPLAKAEAAREELEKFYAWCRPNAKMFAKRSVSDYLNDLRNGWKPEA